MSKENKLDAGGKRELDKITISKAGGGYVAEHCYRTKPSKEYVPYEEPKPFVFTDGQELVNHLDKHLELGLKKGKTDGEGKAE